MGKMYSSWDRTGAQWVSLEYLWVASDVNWKLLRCQGRLCLSYWHDCLKGKWMRPLHVDAVVASLFGKLGGLCMKREDGNPNPNPNRVLNPSPMFDVNLELSWCALSQSHTCKPQMLELEELSSVPVLIWHPMAKKWKKDFSQQCSLSMLKSLIF